MKRARLLLFLGLVPWCTPGCSGGGGGGGGGGPGDAGTGTLSLEVTDAVLDHSLVTSALLFVNEIEVKPASDEDGGFLTIYEGAPIEIDLLDLRNGVTQELAAHDLPSGSYQEVRLVFDDAFLQLVNGNVYTTDDGSLQLTSQATSGLKIKVEPPIVVFAGGNTTVLLDVDLTKTFRPIPANDPLNASTYHLSPVVRAASLLETGEISGVVPTEDPSGLLVPVPNATVYVLPPGEVDVESSIASTATEENGSYALLGIPPGTFDVLATSGALSRRVDGVSVVAGSAITVDLELE
jgi:hypothetical protein